MKDWFSLHFNYNMGAIFCQLFAKIKLCARGQTITEVMKMQENKIPRNVTRKPDKKKVSDAPFIPTHEVPDPPVPNRAHTQMSLGNFDADRELRTGDNALGNFDAK